MAQFTLIYSDEVDLAQRIQLILAKKYQTEVLSTKTDQTPPSYRLASSIVWHFSHNTAESVSQLRQAKQALIPGTPIIVIVKSNSLEFERMVRAVGIFYYLIWPLDEKDLDIVVQTALHQTHTKAFS